MLAPCQNHGSSFMAKLLSLFVVLHYTSNSTFKHYTLRKKTNPNKEKENSIQRIKVSWKPCGPAETYKVHVFWEGHKILTKSPIFYFFYLVTDRKRLGDFVIFFVAFSEYMNCTVQDQSELQSDSSRQRGWSDFICHLQFVISIIDSN